MLLTNKVTEIEEELCKPEFDNAYRLRYSTRRSSYPIGKPFADTNRLRRLIYNAVTQKYASIPATELEYMTSAPRAQLQARAKIRRLSLRQIRVQDVMLKARPPRLPGNDRI